jgi:hypothetical protein
MLEDSDVVPFVAHGIVEVDDVDNLSSVAPGDLMFLSIEVYDAVAEFIDINDVQRNGWKYNPGAARQIGKKNRLQGDVWSRGAYRVVLVNESEDYDVRCYISACANDRESLEEFLKDMEIKRKIEEMDSVVWGGA